jgi:hypothetical protein
MLNTRKKFVRKCKDPNNGKTSSVHRFKDLRLLRWQYFSRGNRFNITPLKILGAFAEISKLIIIKFI